MNGILIRSFALAEKVGGSLGHPLHIKPEFDSQRTSFCILSRLQFRGKVVGALVGIAHTNWAGLSPLCQAMSWLLRISYSPCNAIEPTKEFSSKGSFLRSKKDKGVLLC